MEEPKPRNAPGHLTLLEVLLVLAILGGVLLLVVLPAMREATIGKNEEAALELLSEICNAEGRRLGPGYGSDTLAEIAKTLHDDELATGRKFGYSFVIGIGGYRLQANPLVPGGSGRRHFFADTLLSHGTFGYQHPGMIRYRLGAPASSADSPIE